MPTRSGEQGHSTVDASLPTLEELGLALAQNLDGLGDGVNPNSVQAVESFLPRIPPRQ